MNLLFVPATIYGNTLLERPTLVVVSAAERERERRRRTQRECMNGNNHHAPPEGGVRGNPSAAIGTRRGSVTVPSLVKKSLLTSNLSILVDSGQFLSRDSDRFNSNFGASNAEQIQLGRFRRNSQRDVVRRGARIYMRPMARSTHVQFNRRDSQLGTTGRDDS
jgi:hypothetical protein